MHKNLLFGTLLIIASSHLFSQTSDFTANINNDCAPLVVEFTDQSTGSPVSWNWDFGNGNTSTLQNPGAVYNTPGTYTVSLTVSGGSTKTKAGYIIIYDDPVANFSSTGLLDCAPYEVSFTDLSSAGSGNLTSWSWVFGDGGISTDQHPTYTYTFPGTYSVTLTVENEHGCDGVISKSSHVTVDEFTVDFDADVVNFCNAPATVNFTNNSIAPGTLDYLWDFSDGNTSTSQDVQHTYTSQGSYTVSLEVTSNNSCLKVLAKDDYIQVGNDVAPDFDISAPFICLGDEVTFADNSGSAITSWLWDFGDGNQSTGQSVSHVFETGGTYDITLSAEFQSGCSGIKTKSFTVQDWPVPGFTITRDCETGVVFNNQSTNSDSWSWDFGDGATSIEENPSHTYNSLGTYGVTLEVSNNGICTVSEVIDIVVQENIIAKFSPNKLNDCSGILGNRTLGGCAPYTIHFEDKSSSLTNITSWSWDFGDGSTSSLETVNHTFTDSGFYDVVLKVINATGCTAEVMHQVVVTDVIPEADFSYDKAEACVFEDIQFTDLSSNANWWCWDFGDGTRSQLQNPVHNYKEPGIYTVILDVTNMGCKDQLVISNAIEIKDPWPNFVITKSCSDPYSVTILNGSTGDDVWLWDFGDGNPSSQDHSPSHTYTQTGAYNISLSVSSNTTGCNNVSLVKTATIMDVKADFTADNLAACKNLTVNFTDKSEFALKWLWDFGDGTFSKERNPQGKKYDLPGKYTIGLTVWDADGCGDKKTRVDYINVFDIVGGFDKDFDNHCDELVVNFTDKSIASPPVTGWFWDFGDGNTSTSQNPQHTYSNLGIYSVSLSLANAEGACTVIKEDVIVFTNPVAEFSTATSTHCIDEPLSFQNLSENASSYQWDFGNGLTSSVGNPSANYASAGSYNVTLVATDTYGCTDQIAKNAFIEINKPNAGFIAEQISAECPPLTSTFVDQSFEDISEWYWEFGDGSISNLQYPSNTFTVPGTYDVSLVVTDNTGCKDTATVYNLINLGGPYGSYSISELNGCTNRSVDFEADAINTVKYIWDFGDGQLGEGKSVSHQYENPGTYFPILVLEDNNGCQLAIDEGTELTIFDVSEMDFEISPDYPFVGEEITILHEDVEKAVWIWDMGNGSTFEEAYPTYIYEKSGTFTIKLYFESSDGCTVVREKEVFVQADIVLIPNTFTPNQKDNINETFEIIGLEEGTWKLDVYNRWGKQVYKTGDYKGDWNADKISTGIYFYNLKNAFRKDKSYNGYVHVLR